jgi:hypothetical protein
VVGGAERLPGAAQQQGSLLACFSCQKQKNSETKDAPLAATVRKGREEGKREREKQKAASTTSGAQKREKEIARPLRGEAVFFSSVWCHLKFKKKN